MHHSCLASSSSTRITACFAMAFALALGACGNGADTRFEAVDGGSAGDAAAGDSAGDAAADPPLATDGGPAPERTSLGGAVSARGATFRASRSAKGEGLIDIAFAEVEDVCQTSRSASFTRVLHLTLRSPGASAVGTFSIVRDNVMGGSGAGPQGTAVLWSIHDVGSALCALSNQDAAVSGTIELTKVSADAIGGTVDLTLGSGAGRVQGSFEATRCDSPRAEAFSCPLGI